MLSFAMSGVELSSSATTVREHLNMFMIWT
jgi:hypothetical protein